jgi:hypothetical protein
LAVILLSLTIAAQPRLRKPEYWVGFHGGVSASTVAFTPGVANMTPITRACVLGGNGGFVFRYAGHKYCALQIELNYVHRGWAETSIEGRYSRSLHYIELPLLMNLNFGNKTCRWFFNLGPQIGYCVKDEVNNGILVNGEGQTQYGELNHPFDWGLLAGTGVYFRTRKAGVYQFEFRYDFSLGSLFNNGVTDHFSMANPMDLSFNLAWMWPIVKKSKP